MTDPERIERPGTDTLCTWAQDDDEDEDGSWATSCGQYFTIIDGGPLDNRMRFCCYCGKPIKENTP